MIYARGLHAGLNGDYLVAVHLLFPQAEHSIRWLLHESGAVVSGMDDRGIQEEHDLNRMLYLSELKTMFGDDLTFDLQGLLVERFGINLRNNAAHGLIDLNGFYSAQSVYFWWLVLRLVPLPLIIQQSQSSGNENPASSLASSNATPK